jgi:hypothetical protein
MIRLQNRSILSSLLILGFRSPLPRQLVRSLS